MQAPSLQFDPLYMERQLMQTAARLENACSRYTFLVQCFNYIIKNYWDNVDMYFEIHFQRDKNEVQLSYIGHELTTLQSGLSACCMAKNCYSIQCVKSTSQPQSIRKIHNSDWKGSLDKKTDMPGLKKPNKSENFDMRVQREPRV